jgi:excisionase family DNA binding protein
LTYTIAEAAQAIGVHPHTIRKRIKSGKLGAALVEGANGPEYRIPVGVVHQLAAEAMTERGHPAGTRSAAPSSGAPIHPAADSGLRLDPTLYGPEAAPSAAPSTDSESQAASTSLAIARAQEMAAYTQRLLEPLQLRLAEQAEEIGRLRAELRHSHTRAIDHERSAEETGRLKAELEQARQRVAEFEAVTDELEREQAAAAELTRRPWWRFWG